MPDYAKLRDQAITTPGGWKAFAGQADDSFFLDLRVFDLLYGGDLTEIGQDTLAGYNVNTHRAAGAEDRRWRSRATRSATRSSASGAPPSASDVRIAETATARRDWVQVSRLGNPLVNEVVVPAGLKDAFNAISPDQDADNQALVDRVSDPELPQLIEAIYGIPAPATPRNDLVEIFLTGIADQRTSTAPIQADLTRSSTSRRRTPKAVPAVGDTAAEHERPGDGAARTGSACSAATCRASRTGAGSPTTWSTSSCRRSRARRRPASSSTALAAGDGDAVRERRRVQRDSSRTWLPNTLAVNQAGGRGGDAEHGAAIVPSGSGSSGGVRRTLVPALTGGAALLLLGAGAVSLVRTRSETHRVHTVPEV